MIKLVIKFGLVNKTFKNLLRVSCFCICHQVSILNYLELESPSPLWLIAQRNKKYSLKAGKTKSSKHLTVKVNNRNIRKRFGIRSKIPIKTPKRPQWCRSGVIIVNFAHISYLFLVLVECIKNKLLWYFSSVIPLPNQFIYDSSHCEKIVMSLNELRVLQINQHC